ncbi:flavoprotein [Actinocatenispora rupis]|uniref:Flavoprotein n=1 Tax=Actinocatenispora rupis TaxID=519421 RepID=A0A8J3J708_9ACTN|nr:flavoprotein [Actinocatenispora rupis]GID11244.1 flavoprotein [Actinocatenispora rupis]
MTLAGTGGPVLYAIVCGSPVARNVGTLVEAAQRDGWRVCVVASPTATRFVDVPGLAARTGFPVRSEYKLPGTPDLLPDADAIVVAPATCNTVNKWVAGISDTLPLGILTEAYGRGVPIVAVPYSNRFHAAHPAFVANVARLRSWGVRVLFGDDVCPLPAPGGAATADLPWRLALDAVPVVPQRN